VGVTKVVYVARAKTLVSGELSNVDQSGVRNAVKSLQDYNNALAIRRAGTSSKTKTMLTNEDGVVQKVSISHSPHSAD
jgi:hypothetical protein